MAQRSLVIGSALAAALLVLGLTLWLGHRPMPAPEPRNGDTDPAEFDALPPFDPERVIDPDLAARSQVFEGVDEGYTIVEGDRRVIMTWDRLDPRPQGVYDVRGPRTWVFFDPTRILCIEADRGTIVAPENQPQEGDLIGNVTVTFFEADGDDMVDLDTMRDAQVQARLDRASFSLVLGHIESDSPVRVDGRTVTFQGRGLSLTYNEQRKRIDRLEIAEGQSLRFARDEQGETEDDEPEYEATPVRGASTSDTPAPPPDDNDPSTPTAAPAQFYRARLSDDVRVDVGEDEQRELTMAADTLAAVFNFNPDDDDTNDNTADSADDATPEAPPEPHNEPRDADDDTPASPPHLFTPALTDVTVHWTGPLLLLPLDTAPDDFAAADDVMLTLTGSPATVRTARDETIRGRTIDYLDSIGRLRADSDDEHRVQLASPELGELTGRRLVVNQRAGTGAITGPGTLRAAIDADDLQDAAQKQEDQAQQDQAQEEQAQEEQAQEDEAQEDEAEGASPRDLRIAWQDRLDLAFYLDDETADRGTDRLRALRSAHFHGNVETHHPRFDLTSDTQRITLDHPDQGANDRDALRRIDATGNVNLHARPENEDPLRMQTDNLAIHLDPGPAGDIQPHRVVATGGVRTEQPGQRLSARELELIFATTDSAATQPGTPLFEQRAGIERMIATGDVRVELDEPDTELTGARLVADTIADQIELTAPADELAYVVREDRVLAGRHLLMRESDRSVHVDGEGWFDAQLAADDPADQLRVSWQRAMHYDDHAGFARFVGRVRATTRKTHTTARLSSDDLQLQLAVGEADGTEDENGNEEDEDENENRDDGDGLTTDRPIRTATARGNVRFIAEQHEPDTGKLRTRLRIDGPLMSFDGEQEQIQVLGAGAMLIEDRRPPEDEDPDRDSDRIQFGGRGETLFTWERQLTLDAARNDVRMQGTVQMVHRPAVNDDDAQQIIQLDTEQLFADLSGSGGLGGWAGDEATSTADTATPELRLVRADDNVRVLYDAGRSIVRSDHLQYTADDQIVRLWADEDRLVRIRRDDQPAPLSFEEGFWNLATDEFDARRLGPGVVPVPE